MAGGSQADLVLIDASAWIGYFARRGYEGIKARIEALLDEDRAATAGPVTLELIQGCRSAREKEHLLDYLRGVHWIAVEDRHWFLAGQTAWALRREGVTVSAIDALIATLAESTNCELLHLDSDFERIARHTSLRLARI